MIFTFLKMALKFICSSSLLEECGSQNKVATDEFISNVNFRDKREIIVIRIDRFNLKRKCKVTRSGFN